MNVARILAVTALAVAPSLVQADDRAELSVPLSVEVAAAPAEIWALIGDFQDLGWHPAVFSTDGDGGNDSGATRLLTLMKEGGPTIAEELTAYDGAAMSYSYIITEVAPEVLPVDAYSATIAVSAAGNGARIDWQGSFKRAMAEGVTDEAATGAITGVYQAGLDALVAGFGQ
ncbi:MAG: SRPBCC family protein [Albidovulum sp.]|uniref:SRPBCC family protein n=1 Tax=Albidovulum sp. TaxID=1872424 RepID=UPI003CA4E1F4